MGRRVRTALMLVAGAGIPYAWFHEDFGPSLQQGAKSVQSAFGSVVSGSSSATPGLTNVEKSGQESLHGGWWAATTSTPPGAVAPVAMSIDEAIRFDVSPRWVVDHWPRISTIRSVQHLEGMRVPLLTGTREIDFAGSLTYYFDHNQRVQRITLHGQIGEIQPLTDVVLERFQLRSEPALGPGMYLTRWNGRPVSVLRLAHNPVVRSEAPQSRYLVDMEINDPNSPAPLSSEFAQMLARDRDSQRWSP